MQPAQALDQDEHLGKRPKGAAYVTLLIGAPEGEAEVKAMRSQLGGIGHLQSKAAYLNRTICFQNRLRELNSSYPLVVVHDLQP